MNARVQDSARRWTPANCLTLFRLAFAAPAMVVVALAGWREAFVWILAASFTSDFLDGTVARLGGGPTRFGARLDSWADGAAYCTISLGVVLLWPRLVANEWPAMATIIASFAVPGAIGYLKFGEITSYHTLLVKAAVGCTAAALLLALCAGPSWPLRLAALLALAAALEELAISCVLDAPRSNVGSLYKVWRARRDAAR